MAWKNEKELTPAQVKAAQTAGVWVDRPGLGADYPKAVYKVGDEEDSMHLGKRLLVQGKYPVNTGTVRDADEELEAIEQGWHTTPELAAAAAKLDLEQIKASEAAASKVLNEAQKRGPGRPPKDSALQPVEF